VKRRSDAENDPPLEPVDEPGTEPGTETASEAAATEPTAASAPPAPTAAPPTPEDQERATWRGTAIAVLIALIAITGTLVAWRAEVAGSGAADAERDGLAVAVTAQGARLQAEVSAREEERLFRRYAAARTAEDELRAQAEAAGSEVVRADLARQADIERALAAHFYQQFVPDYVVPGIQADLAEQRYDVAARAADSVRQDQVDTDADRRFRSADRLDAHRRTLVELGLVLIAALVFATLAQLSRGRRSLLLAGSAVLCYGGALAGILAAEV